MNDDFFTPSIAALVNPKMNLPVVHINKVGQPIAIDIADQDTSRIVAEWKVRTVLHVDTRAPVAIADVRPVIDIAVVNEQVGRVDLEVPPPNFQVAVPAFSLLGQAVDKDQRRPTLVAWLAGWNE